MRFGTLERNEQVKAGIEREKHITNALQSQYGLIFQQATEVEDKERKIDRWLIEGSKRTPVQIKYRESGDDLLVEVYSKWYGWGSEYNKIGRDMIGSAQLYLVLRKDKRTVVIVDSNVLKKIVNEMLEVAEGLKWENKVFNHFKVSGQVQLRVQHDPYDGRMKMVAYVPANVVIADHNAKVYQIRLKD